MSLQYLFKLQLFGFHCIALSFTFKFYLFFCLFVYLSIYLFIYLFYKGWIGVKAKWKSNWMFPRCNLKQPEYLHSPAAVQGWQFYSVKHIKISGFDSWNLAWVAFSGEGTFNYSGKVSGQKIREKKKIHWEVPAVVRLWNIFSFQ